MDQKRGHRLEGKIALVTGAGSGIGREPLSFSLGTALP